MRALIPFLLIWSGCGPAITSKGAASSGQDSGEDDGPWSDDGDGGNGDDDDHDGVVRPEISYAAAVCDEGGTAHWDFSAIASDPQGIDTLNSEGQVEVFFGDESYGTILLTLDSDQARYKGEEDANIVGVLCSVATEYDFAFTVSDVDGNLSETKIVTGERES